MKPNFMDRVAIGVFLIFAAAYLFLATYVCQYLTHNTFDVVQNVHIFDIDDTYRLFLAREPFATSGLWMWNFILPANVAFDGFFSWVTNHSVYWMRTSHLMAVLGSLYLVYRAGRHLGISAAWMLLSCCILLLMPLYALLSMSFYGESLLGAAMGVVIYALVTNRERILVFFVSLFPLLRPEGIFYLGFMVLKRLHERRFISVAFIVLPGFIFFCVVMYFFPSLGDFMGWRGALDSQYPYTPSEEAVMGYALMPYYTINPLWWLAGLAGAALPAMRRLRPLFAGAVLFSLYLGVQCLFEEARGEPRYFFSVLPLMALSVAACLDVVAGQLYRRVGKWAWAACGLFLAFIAVENFAQNDALRAHLFGDRRWPLAGETGANRYFYLEPPEITEWRMQTARFLEAYANYDRSIKKIIVNVYPVFSELRPEHLPADVVVEFSPMTPRSTMRNYGGNFYSMFPDLPQFAFYRFYPALNAPLNDGNSYALYVGALYNGIHPPLFANPVFQVYKVGYMPAKKQMGKDAVGVR